MCECVLVSDLHGHTDRYTKLFGLIEDDHPAAVFLGGDLLPSGLCHRGSATGGSGEDFLEGVIARGFARLRDALGARYPRVFVILGNDDPRIEEAAFRDLAARGLWTYAHGRRASFGDFDVYGYACIPPSPFRLKDWERYDVSRYVDPGCVPPAEGVLTVPVREHELEYGTIQADLDRMTEGCDLGRGILLLHCPPYQTKLDRAALDGQSVDHAPLDIHIGSIAIRRLIESRQPLLTLHGHVHESARLTGCWRDRIGSTHLFSAAHDGPELAVVRFDPANPANAARELL
ncbi:MAG: metallophosphoesterase [Phycisphaerales bacterium]|nr:metallophosphoesterase [Phycisphaerales bacterium]